MRGAARVSANAIAKTGSAPFMTLSSQYKDSHNLQARGNLHARYANRNWFDWVAGQIGLSPESDVLDIGCGAGWFWSLAASHLPCGLRLTLTDTSQGMVKEAIERLSAKGHFTEVAGQTANAMALPFPDQSFDGAIAMHMLYHVAMPEKAIDEMVRILRPNGLVAITTNSDGNMRELFDLGSKAFGGTAADPAASLFGVSAAQTLLACRFGSIEVRLFEDTYSIDDAGDIFHYLTSFPPGIDSTEHQKNNLRDLIDERLSRSSGVLKVRRESALICGR